LEMGVEDLLSLSVPLQSGRAYLYARPRRTAVTESSRFHVVIGPEGREMVTVGQRLDPDDVKELQNLRGIPVSDVRFEYIPRLSTPIDLYSLGVLGIRSI